MSTYSGIWTSLEDQLWEMWSTVLLFVAQFILRDLPSRATIGCDWIVVGEVTGILCPWCSRRASIVRMVVVDGRSPQRIYFWSVWR